MQSLDSDPEANPGTKISVVTPVNRGAPPNRRTPAGTRGAEGVTRGTPPETTVPAPEDRDGHLGARERALSPPAP